MTKNKFASVFAALVILFTSMLTMPVMADGGDFAVKANTAPDSVVTEYYSDDLVEPLPPLAVDATPITQPPAVPAKGAVLIEASTGKVLFEQNPHEKLPCASINKIMSLILVMEAVEAGELELTQMIPTSEHAASMGGSQIWLQPGEEMSVDDLIKATVIGSANDAITSLAEAVSGSEDGFVVEMNLRAQDLGMNDTTFTNCMGLDEDGNLTSAYDVALMSQELLKHELIKEYSTIWMDTLRDGQTQLVNTNKLVRYYPGVTGLKTGTTSKAGFCLSASCSKNGMDLIAVVLGCPSGDERFNSARKLLDYGYANFVMVNNQLDEILNSTIKVKNGEQSQIKLEPSKNSQIVVPKGKEESIVKEVILPAYVTAPIKKGDNIGKVVYKIGEEVVDEVQINAAEDVKEMSLSIAFSQLMDSLLTK